MPQSLARSLGFAPLVPLWVLVTLGVLAVVLCGYALFRRTKGAFFRLAALLSVLVWLAGPQRLHESWHVLPETALLLVDQSPSMSVGQRASIARQAASASLRARPLSRLPDEPQASWGASVQRAETPTTP